MVWGAISGFLLSQVFGALWYSQKVCGRPWMKATFPGRTYEQVGQGFAVAYTFALVSSATMSLLLQFILVTFLKVKTVEAGVKTALGLASLLTLADIPHLCFSKRNIIAFVVDHLYDAGVLAITSAMIMYFS